MRWICYFPFPGSHQPRYFWDLSALAWIASEEPDGWIEN